MSDHSQQASRARRPNYVRVWAILAVLLMVSVSGPMLGIRVVTLITAFGIALIKAYMVAKNFMHLNVEKPIVRWVLGSVLILMVLLYAGVAPDVQKSNGLRWRKNSGFHHVSERARDHGRVQPAVSPGTREESKSHVR